MKKISLALCTLLSIITTYSCANQSYPINNEKNIEKAQVLSTKAAGVKFKFVKSDKIAPEIITSTLAEGQKIADKESKKRDIDYFNLPKNPVGLEISTDKKLAYILNYIGTSKNTNELNIEMRTFYTPEKADFAFNYSGPVTNSRVKKVAKNERFLAGKKLKNSELEFELITGLPPEYIINTYERYTDNLKNTLDKIYDPKTINFSFEDVLIFAIHYNQEVIGFYFDSHFNKLVLGERKYADLTIGAIVSIDNELKAQYALVGFNPKTELNKDPVYKIINEDNLLIVSLGEL